ncbi:MAG: hypothetical protein ACREDE_04830, partial [Thermoplasmata archaeon]
LDWSPARLRVRWSGPGALSVAAGADPVTVGPGASADFGASAPDGRRGDPSVAGPGVGRSP